MPFKPCIVMIITLTSLSCYWISMRDNELKSRPEVGGSVPSPLPSQRQQNSNCQQDILMKKNRKNYMAERVRGFCDLRPTYTKKKKSKHVYYTGCRVTAVLLTSDRLTQNDI